MQTRPLKPEAETVSVNKRDLIEAWSLLERLVVSLRKIGSHYAIPQGEAEHTPQQRQQMLEALEQVFTPDLWRELAHGRRVIGEYLPNDEAEAISDQLDYWEPTDNKQ